MHTCRARQTPAGPLASGFATQRYCLPTTRRRRPPRLSGISGLRVTAARMLPVYASSSRSPAMTQHLVPAGLPALAGQGSTCWVPVRGFTLHPILLSQALPGARRVALGIAPQGSHGSGRARLTHPALRTTDSLRGRDCERRARTAAGIAAAARRIVPSSCGRVVSGDRASSASTGAAPVGSARA